MRTSRAFRRLLSNSLMASACHMRRPVSTQEQRCWGCPRRQNDYLQVAHSWVVCRKNYWP
jgi:hypothetical protein